MIHSPEVINRINQLLKISGVKHDDVMEEMTDHYLTEIESAVSSGSQEQKAIREVYQTIANTDLKTLDDSSRFKQRWVIGFLTLTIFLALIFFIYQSNTKVEPESPNSITTIATFQAPSGWPINTENINISSGFGLRYHPISQTKKFHKGIDIRAKKGTPVLATGNGIIQETGYNTSSGNYIIIKHNKKYSTRYTHLLLISIEEGIEIKAGSKIGEVGSTGLSMSPHLHYEVIKNKKVIDPMDVVNS